jgi:hypothetical protein
MISSRRVRIGFVMTLAGVALAAGAASSGADLRLGGSLGFGLTARDQGGGFRWDWDSAREDTSLAELKLGIEPVPDLQAFVRFGARLDESRQTDDAPVFELREAMLRYARRFTPADSLTLRGFARQPSALWLDHGLGAPIDPRRFGDNAQGVRASLRLRALLATVIAADRSGFDPRGDGATARDGDAVIVRLRADATRWAGLRVGGTFIRHIPKEVGVYGEVDRVDVRRRDLSGLDARLHVGGVQVLVDYSQVDPDYVQPGAEAAQEPGMRRSWNFKAAGRGTDIIPSTAALRAELRAPGLGSSRWGWIGFAPGYRAIGAHHSNPLAASQPDVGSPRRGLDGYRLEAWYRAAAWPLWLRQVYERHTQFRDADRRVIRQVSEIETALTSAVSARLFYSQRQTREFGPRRDEYHDDVLVELRATNSDTRMRAQLALVDVNAPARRDVATLEASARVTQRVQVVVRGSFTREQTRLRRALFVEIQYWHLPQFEVAVHIGPDWLGDSADPALDADLLAAASSRDLVRLHFRGWF